MLAGEASVAVISGLCLCFGDCVRGAWVPVTFGVLLGLPLEAALVGGTLSANFRARVFGPLVVRTLLLGVLD